MDASRQDASPGAQCALAAAQLAGDGPSLTRRTAASRAGATKRLRTRQRLIEAADELMRTGMETSGEDIAKQAGVSKATFYNFYKSRNALCLDAFIELIYKPVQEIVSFGTAASLVEAHFKTFAGGRSHLVRAALLGRLESTNRRDDIVESVASLMWSKGNSEYYRDFRMRALWLLDTIARSTDEAAQATPGRHRAEAGSDRLPILASALTHVAPTVREPPPGRAPRGSSDDAPASSLQ